MSRRTRLHCADCIFLGEMHISTRNDLWGVLHPKPRNHRGGWCHCHKRECDKAHPACIKQGSKRTDESQL